MVQNRHYLKITSDALVLKRTDEAPQRRFFMINTDDMTKEELVEYWQMVMEDFSDSNKTKTEYCKENEIPLSTFNYWVNRLEELKQAD
ncbi:MAG: portal protein, partial [Lachnospiraceae bacterium]|nr:portal protein [Lachnospiraceae bacterium]